MVLSLNKMLTIGILPSFLKKAYYRMRGAKIGKGVKFGMFSTIDANEIEIGDYTKIGHLVQIRAKKFKIGAYSEIRMMTVIDAQYVNIGNETIIMEQVIIGGMESWDSKFVVGDRCKIFPFCFINPTRPIIIGNDVGIGGANYLFTHGSWSNYLEGGPISFGPIIIEDRVWLPWRVFVLPNVKIGHDSVIGAGSVLTKSIPPCSLAAGVPATVRKTIENFVHPPEDKEKIEKLVEIFGQFEEFLKIHNLRVKEAPGKSNIHASIRGGMIVDKYQNVVGYIIVSESISKSISQLNDAPIFAVSYNRISDSIKCHIEQKGGAWFEIKGYQWGGKRSKTAIYFKDFFSRFGIRFKSIDLE